MSPGTDWQIDRIVRVTDGDSLRVVRRRRTLLDGLRIETTDADFINGVPIRLINLDTPERGHDDYLEARNDVVNWLGRHPHLSITTWPGGGFDRLLGDIWVTGDRSNTLSKWMLIERNWDPYVDGA
jgi:endonuclease YncB( thermonuclease family)